MTRRRVVVTGLGAVTPLGLDVATTWQAVLTGQSGVSLVEAFDVTDYPSQIAATVKNFDATQFLPAKDVRKMDTFIHYGVAAAKEALDDSGLSITDENRWRFGISIGSGIGGLPMIERLYDTIQTQGPKKVSPFFIPAAIVNMVSGQIAITHGLKGPNISIVSACTTGTHNVGYAARTIQYGDADIMLAGGTESTICPCALAGFAALRALSKRNDDPTHASRPWDRDRDGFVLGEGAGILVLEEYQHAKKRNAKIYAELVGFGMTDDAFHMTAPDETSDGARFCMGNAIKDANLDPSSIDYINAHSTSTPTGDVLELNAIKKVLGTHVKDVPVSSTKSMTGHLLGAAGSVEAIFSILAIRDNVAPPTINLDNPDEGCDLNLVPHEAQQHKMNVVLSNSFGFGGTNGTLIFQRV
ncbi:MAG: beta-ketoacyl-ACP synthase II [Gammaproteobacteria bacterium]